MRQSYLGELDTRHVGVDSWAVLVLYALGVVGLLALT
jgi:hypothetical protein